MKYVLILLGALTAILLHSSLMILQAPFWIDAASTFENNHLNSVGEFHKLFFIVWFTTPKVALLAAVCGVMLSYTSKVRFFMYPVVITTIFTFYVLPKLPILSTLFSNAPSELGHISVITRTLVFFIVAFGVFSILKYNKPKQSDVN